jgi:uncharacterized protein
MSSRQLRLAAIATAAGAFSGLFGVGGGTIIVPLLVLWLGYGQKEATGTSLAAIIVIGVLAAGAQAVYGNVDLWKGLLIAVPAIAGVVTGTAIQQRISERAVALAFVVLLLASAAVLIFYMEAPDLIGLLVLGFAAGMAGGLLGVGGGVLFVPALVVLADESQLGAQATSLVAIVLVSLVGTWRQRGYGNVRLRDGLLIGVLSPLGVLVGVAVANVVSERTLELSFAAVQLAFAWQLAGRAGLR